MGVSILSLRGHSAVLSHIQMRGACDVSALHRVLLYCAQHASFVLLASCPILFASSTKVDAPLDQVSLSLCWELADCHLSVAGTSQDTGSPLRAGHVTQLSVLNALQTSPIAVLLSI